MERENIKEVLKQRILVLDGAMGTMIQRYKLDEDDFRGSILANHNKPLQGNNDILSLTKPEIILEIHQEYFRAGADIAETNTFNANAISQADYSTEDLVYKMNLAAAKLAREAADYYSQQEPDKPRFVAGSLGPTNRTASLSPDVNNPGYRAVTFDDLKEAYKEQARGLVDGGVDILFVETVFDTLNAKAGLFGIQELFDEIGRELPIMVSGTITDASGRTLSGQTTQAFLISIGHINLLSVGLNCALGADQLRPYLQVLDKESPFFISAHPNAGLPNEFGEYDETPELMGQQIEEYLKEGLVNIVGGCCGTNPEHIRVIADLAKNYKPRLTDNK
jgi:5-methyltetrahydrofolate--homocysteine methyltransferase